MGAFRLCALRASWRGQCTPMTSPGMVALRQRERMPRRVGSGQQMVPLAAPGRPGRLVRGALAAPPPVIWTSLFNRPFAVGGALCACLPPRGSAEGGGGLHFSGSAGGGGEEADSSAASASSAHAGASTKTATGGPAAEWATNNILQQQLPPGHSLQPLLQPLLQPAAGGAAGGPAGGGATTTLPPPALPGNDVGPIAATSTSLAAVPPAPVSPAAASAAAATPPGGGGQVLATIDVDATELLPLDTPAAAATAAASPPSAGGWRVVGVCAAAAFLCYLDRTNISTAIVPMAEQYGWDKSFCGAVLSAFFAGYGATQVIGGKWADRYGGSAVLAGGLALWSAATALTPLAAAAGTGPLLAARVMLGLAQGVAFPAMHALLARHVPGHARSVAIGLIMAAAHCGTALGFGASPGIIDGLGWGWTYYLFGGAALLWLPLWADMARRVAAAGGAATTAMAAAAAAASGRAATAALTIASASSATAAAAAAAAAATAGAPRTAGAAAALCSAALLQHGAVAVPPAPRRDAAAPAHPLLDALALERQAVAGGRGQQQEQQQERSPRAAPTAVAASPPVPTGITLTEHDTTNKQQARPADAEGVGFWPLMRRKEVWAIAVAQYTAGWGFYGLLAWLPQFFMEHCGLQLSQLGSFTLAPYLLQAAVGASAGLLADNLITRRKWGVRDVRVLMQVAGMLGPAACLFAAASPFGAHSPYMATSLITLGMGLSALTCSGVSASHLDIAPRHAGVVFGVGNTAGTLAGLVAVPGLGYVLQHTGDWSLAFGLAAAHNVVGALLWARWVGDKPLPEDGDQLPDTPAGTTTDAAAAAAAAVLKPKMA